MLRFQEETFADVEEELKGLIHEHWQEVTSDPDLPLSPDWETYRLMCSRGRLVTTTARDAGELVGYVFHIIHSPLHYRYLKMAVDDSHFLKAKYRRGRAGMELLKFAELVLRSHGVERVSYHSKARPDISKRPVFERLGYKLQEYIFVKQL